MAPAEEFRLSEVQTSPDRSYRNPGSGSIVLMIILEGRGRIETTDSLPVGKGDSLMIPASTGPYSLHGSLHLYTADVPL
jgi:mannose-6-phosphate isomerase class I